MKIKNLIENCQKSIFNFSHIQKKTKEETKIKIKFEITKNQFSLF